MKKNIFTIITIIILLLILAFFYQFIDEENNNDGGDFCIEVLTDARNPETGEIKTFNTPCDVPEGWETLETDKEEFSRGEEKWSRYRNDDLGVRFEYRVEPDGYILIDSEYGGPSPENFVEYISLFNKSEYLELLDSDVPREGPPGISLIIFENPNNYSPREWVENEKMLSNISLLIGQISEIEFSGVSAVRYKYDGLYTNESIVALNNGKIYMFTGAYFDEESVIRKDFLEMLEHISLY